LLAALRRVQETAHQAQAEARRAREQTEALQRRLDELTQELASLRSGMADLKATVPVRQATPDSQPQAAASKLPSEDPPSAIRHPQSEDRLAKLEEQIEVNTAQIKEQAQTKVESDARFKVRLYGMALANFFVNTDGSGRAVPLFAQPPGTPSSGVRNNFGNTLRQTIFGLAMEGPRVGAARLGAEIEFDFFGGSISGQEGDVLGALRLRTGSMHIDGPRTSLVVGQRAPLVSPLNPTSLAAVWFPALTNSGNLWQWRPQIIFEHRVPLDESSSFVMQGGVMMPFGETVSSVNLGGHPGYQTRMALRRKLNVERRLELGAGGLYHRRNFSFGRQVDSYVVAGDWLLPLDERVELSGEVYYGRAVSLGELSGGRIDRVFALTGPLNNPATRIRGIHSAGGWAQVSLQALRDLEFNLAYGQEDPRNRETLDPTARLKNQTFSSNFIYRLRPTFLVSLEYRRFWTDYATARRASNHVNLTFGYVF
jgi:hypothetical protein